MPDLRVSCTAVRIPVFVSHSEAVHVETRDPRHARARARAVRCGARGRRPGRPGRTRYPLASEAAGRDEIFVGRVRRTVDPDGRGLAFWVVSDNLRKGAATNAVELAEVLVERTGSRHASTRGAPRYRGPCRNRGWGTA
jgi:aspartate-semialdehyde dehydrogenase